MNKKADIRAFAIVQPEALATVILAGEQYGVWHPGDLPMRDGMRAQRAAEIYENEDTGPDERAESLTDLLRLLLKSPDDGQAPAPGVVHAMSLDAASELAGYIGELLEKRGDAADPLDSSSGSPT